MSDEIVIHGNGLRVLSKIFLAIVPVSHSQVKAGEVYPCVVDGIGVIGAVECIRVSEVYLSRIDKRLNDLTDCLIDFVGWYHERGIFLADYVQLGYFKFQSRSEAKFKQLLDRETKSIGLYLGHQPTLFTS